MLDFGLDASHAHATTDEDKGTPMKLMGPRILACIALAAAGLAHAQDEEDASTLDRIEVTGSRISYRDLLDTPAVSVVKPGDYLVQRFRLINDTRDADARDHEIHETILRLVGGGGGRYVVLQGDAYRTQLDRSNYRIATEAVEKRADTSQTTLYLRAELARSAADAERVAGDMRGFLKAASAVGRTEIELVGDTALGLGKPERFRYEIVAAIARDTGQLAQAMGLRCRIALDGLGSRIEWQRVSAGELLLYIPYTLRFDECDPGSHAEPRP